MIKYKSHLYHVVTSNIKALKPLALKKKKKRILVGLEDGGEIGGSRVHFPSAPVKHLADLRNRLNSQRYSSIYEDWRQR